MVKYPKESREYAASAIKDSNAKKPHKKTSLNVRNEYDNNIVKAGKQDISPTDKSLIFGQI